MDHDNQILIPPSFLLIYTDTARQQLTADSSTISAQYECCEDLATHLIEQAQTLYHVQAPSEAKILEGIFRGLCDPDSGLSAAQAQWVTYRLAELLNWPCPALTPPSAP